jgi:hypothetical protein
MHAFIHQPPADCTLQYGTVHRGPTFVWFCGMPWRPKPSIRLDTDQWALVGPVWTFELECSWLSETRTTVSRLVYSLGMMIKKNIASIKMFLVCNENNHTKKQITAAKPRSLPVPSRMSSMARF